jgi:hypothetical protein
MTSTDLIIYRNELKADIKKIKNMLKEERWNESKNDS